MLFFNIMLFFIATAVLKTYMIELYPVNLFIIIRAKCTVYMNFMQKYLDYREYLLGQFFLSH